MNLWYFFNLLQIFVSGLSRLLCAHGDAPIGSSIYLREEYLTREDEIPINYLPKKRANGNDVGIRPQDQKVNQAEWRTIASVMDRIFFLLYVIGMLLSVIFVFPR